MSEKSKDIKPSNYCCDLVLLSPLYKLVANSNTGVAKHFILRCSDEKNWWNHSPK